MTFSTRIKDAVNTVLEPLNARVETLTARTAERRRLEAAAASGWFARPVFPLPAAFERMDARPLLEAIARSAKTFEAMREAGSNSVGFSIGNEYFPSPDAEVLYAAMGLFAPRRVVEVGSGNSTRLMRQAIRDFGLATRLTAIDPQPRTDIEPFVDEFLRTPVERLAPGDIASRLGPGDLLLIDSSHEVRAANDVAFLYLQVLPLLREGVLVHIHDIFLPYEVPADFVLDNGWDWCEQYLVQAMLAGGARFDVLWAGHYLQRTMAGFNERFALWSGGRATSLLLRVTP